VGTVHDFSGAHVSEKYDPARMFFIKKITPAVIRKLDMVLTVSECSKTDIVNLCNIPASKVVVTPNGVDLETYKVGDKAQAVGLVEKKYAVRSPYILFVSRIEHPGKNHARLIKAFDKMKSATGLPHQLVLAGSKWSRAEEVYEVAAKSPYKEDILFIGFVDGVDLPYLYRGADMFVFPSLFEGFGIPILEAMASGVPTACSNLSSMPEVAGDAALLFDPYDENSISESMSKMLTDTELANQFVRKGLERSQQFSWKNTALKTMDVIAKTWEANH
jgi:glycosyltransferase involved in cell wall biosynthesis